MRGVVLVLAGLVLLGGGGTVIVIADQQRLEAVDQARTALEQAKQRLLTERKQNSDLSVELVRLLAAIDAKEEALADTEGLLP